MSSSRNFVLQEFPVGVPKIEKNYRGGARLNDPITATIGAVAGGLISSSGAKSAAKTQAAAATEAAAMQAEAARFKPYDVTTGFGQSQFDVDNETASYTLDPRLAAMRDLLYGGATSLAPSQASQDYYNQVQQQAQQKALGALGMDINQAAGQEYNAMQGLLAPTRERENATLSDSLFKTGRLGYGTASGDGGGYINPQMYSLMMARGQQDQGMAQQALQTARTNQTNDIQNYFNLAGQAPVGLAGLYNNASGVFGQGTTIEQLGMGAMQSGIDIGGRANTANTNAANALAAGINNAASYRAANTMGQANMLGNALPSVAQGVQGLFSNQYATGANPQFSTGNWFNSTGFNTGTGGSGYSVPAGQQADMLNQQWSY